MTYWFDPMVGGGGSGGIIGGIPNVAPAMSTAQINASMGWNPAAQAQTTNLYGPMGFGGQTAYYAGVGAGYGRQVAPSSPAAVAAQHGTPAPAAPAPAADPWATGTSPFEGYGLPGGGGAGSFSPSPNYPGGVALSPLSSYQGTGYNPFDLSIYSPAAQGNVGGSQPQAAAPSPDFDFRWGDTPNLSGRPFQQEYEDWFNDVTAPARGAQGGWEQSYLEENPDLMAAAQASGKGVNAFAQEHANIYGGAEGRQLFDAVKYLQNNPDVAASGMGAWQHYDKFGRGEGREKTLGNVFDPATYLQNNQDVAAAGVDPRTHWLQFGQKEGREGGGVVTASRDNIARALMQGTPSGAVLGMTGPGGRNYGDWNPMTAPGSDLNRQQLVNRGNAVDMPSGQIGGPSPPTYGAPPAGNLGAQGIYQDPFGGFVPGRMVGPEGLPADYQPGFVGQFGFRMDQQ